MNQPDPARPVATQPEEAELMAQAMQPSTGAAPQGYAAELQAEVPPDEDMSMNSPCL